MKAFPARSPSNFSGKSMSFRSCEIVGMSHTAKSLNASSVSLEVVSCSKGGNPATSLHRLHPTTPNNRPAASAKMPCRANFSMPRTHRCRLECHSMPGVGTVKLRLTIDGESSTSMQKQKQTCFAREHLAISVIKSFGADYFWSSSKVRSNC